MNIMVLKIAKPYYINLFLPRKFKSEKGIKKIYKFINLSCEKMQCTLDRLLIRIDTLKSVNLIRTILVPEST